MEVLFPQKVLEVYFAVHTSVANIPYAHSRVPSQDKMGQIPEIT